MHPELERYLLEVGWSDSQPSRFYTNHSIDEFFNSLPYLIGVEHTALRIIKAILNKESVCVYSDYDADAITATAVMIRGLKYLGIEKKSLDFYVPDRFTEGYGINKNALITLSNSYDVVISVDCGINSVEEVSEAQKQEKPADIIITDHHKIIKTLPEAFAVINPQISYITADCDIIKKNIEKFFSLISHFEKLSFIDHKGLNDIKKKYEENLQKEIELPLSSSVTGVGVAWFTLIWTAYIGILIGVFPQKVLRKMNGLLPFVAIGTIADCQSVLDETNRTLIKAGIHLIRTKTIISDGLKELCRQTELLSKIESGYIITSKDIAFGIAPILNASGRINHASLSIALLIGEEGCTVEYSQYIDPKFCSHGELFSAEIIARDLIEINNERKEIVKYALEEVDTFARKQFEEHSPVIWLEGDWNKGIIGLLASRVCNDYSIPTVVVSYDNDNELVGSLRAPEGYDLAQAIRDIALSIIKGGGHPGAAGFTIDAQYKDKVKKEFVEAIQKQNNLNFSNDFTSKMTQKRIRFIDVPEEVAEYTQSRKEILLLHSTEGLSELTRTIYGLEPFGVDFQRPKVLVKVNPREVSFMGNQKNHLKMTDNFGYYFVKFFLEDYIKESLLDISLQIDTHNFKSQVWCLCEASQNVWNNSVSIQYIIQRIWVVS